MKRDSAALQSGSDSRDDRKRVGRAGEAIARRHLEHLGWRVLQENYRCKQGEIDIVAEEPTRDGTVLVFVEVKTRRGRAHGSPMEAVDAVKQKKIGAVALAYLAERDVGGAEPACRFDVVEVHMGADGSARVDLVRAAFVLE